MVTPAGWLFPLLSLGLYAFMGVAVGFTVAAMAALFSNVRPSVVALDVVVGGLGGLLGAMIAGRASADVTSFANGRPVQGGWQAVVVEHEYLVPVALVVVLVTVVHLFVATRRRRVPDAA
jgi:hypothetical protein